MSAPSDAQFLAGITFMATGGRNGKTTEHVHWLGGMGGVILGPNYDFGDRDASTIMRDLQSVGIDAVEAGEPDALLAYPVIYQHLTGGGDEAQISLSLALAKNPSGVLTLLNSAAEIKFTCVSNLIEPEPSVERAWYRNAELALSKIDAKSSLAARRDTCLEIMRSDDQYSRSET